MAAAGPVVAAAAAAATVVAEDSGDTWWQVGMNSCGSGSDRTLSVRARVLPLGVCWDGRVGTPGGLGGFLGRAEKGGRWHGSGLLLVSVLILDHRADGAARAMPGGFEVKLQEIIKIRNSKYKYLAQRTGRQP